MGGTLRAGRGPRGCRRHHRAPRVTRLAVGSPALRFRSVSEGGSAAGLFSDPGGGTLCGCARTGTSAPASLCRTVRSRQMAPDRASFPLREAGAEPAPRVGLRCVPGAEVCGGVGPGKGRGCGQAAGVKERSQRRWRGRRCRWAEVELARHRPWSPWAAWLSLWLVSMSVPY